MRGSHKATARGQYCQSEEIIQMTFEEAFQLVIQEGAGAEGIVVQARMGDFPELERMSQLVVALKTVEEALAGETMVDRNLAFALYGLTFHFQGHYVSWENSGRIHSSELNNAMVEMFMVVESILDETFRESSDEFD